MQAKRIALALAIALLVTPAMAAGVMTERQARAAAVAILKGDPYGTSDKEVLENITAARLIAAGSVCGAKVTSPVWQFQVFVPKERNPSGDSDISGYLVIDARTGEMVCAGLPLLD